jgi:hypothetical protein
MIDTDFRLPTDEEENAELSNVLGIDISDKMEAVPQAQLDAIASYHLQGICDIDAELARYQAAFNNELKLLTAKYDGRMQPLRTRREEKEAKVKLIASISDFGKKAKSRVVGYGRFGAKTTPEHLEVADDAAVLGWAETSAPHLVRATIQLPLDKARAVLDEGTIANARLDVPKAPLKKYFEESGEEIPGTQIVPAADEFFAKPEPLV